MSAAILVSTLNASSKADFELTFILCLHFVHNNARLDSDPQSRKKEI